MELDDSKIGRVWAGELQRPYQKQCKRYADKDQHQKKRE
jgi:hypothetical protein